MSHRDVDGPVSESLAKCGVVIIGHGSTASALLDAARQVIPGDGLADARHPPMDAIAEPDLAGGRIEHEVRVVTAGAGEIVHA